MTVFYLSLLLYTCPSFQLICPLPRLALRLIRMSIRLHFSPTLRCTIDLPSSKSISNRVLTIHALSQGKYRLQRLAVCDDTTAMQTAIAQESEEINVGAAGTAMRFSTALLAATPGTHRLTGSPRMLERPIRPLVDALRAVGAEIHYLGEEGYPPLLIRGKQLEGGGAEVIATISSQYISALLMVAPTMRQGLTLRLQGELTSRPYVDLTLSLMERFGVKSSWNDAHTLHIAPQRYALAADFSVEGDWSAASYWYSLVALSSDAQAAVQLLGVEAESLQGDSRVKEFFEPLGVCTAFNEEGALLTKVPRTPLDCYVLDLTHQPDLAQTLVVTAALLQQPFRIKGLHTLRIKETDRILALQQELAKLGYLLTELEPGTLCWDGSRCDPMPSPTIATYDDHRMAMAFAPAALHYQGLTVLNPEVVSKSYPNFWQHLTPLLLSR